MILELISFDDETSETIRLFLGKIAIEERTAERFDELIPANVQMFQCVACTLISSLFIPLIIDGKKNLLHCLNAEIIILFPRFREHIGSDWLSVNRSETAIEAEIFVLLRAFERDIFLPVTIHDSGENDLTIVEGVNRCKFHLSSFPFSVTYKIRNSYVKVKRNLYKMQNIFICAENALKQAKREPANRRWIYSFVA